MISKKPLTILAIESSCDETACAIVQKSSDEELVTVLSSTTATSLVKHKVTKGIVPEVAAREQLKFILPVIEETIKDHKDMKFDAVAVTVGPGLVGSLLVGIETARALAMAWNLPVIPVNHVQAHPYANFILQENNFNAPNLSIQSGSPHLTRSDRTELIDIESLSINSPQFPLLSWVISGGHTDLYLMNSHEDIVRLGGTVDDAAGECFDKCARVLGFDYPGGPFIEKLVEEASKECSTQSGSSQLTRSDRTKFIDMKSLSINLPRPLLHEKTFNMSFSGLKTAFLRSFNENKTNNDLETLKKQLATELQEAVSDVIVKRTQQALEQYPQINSVIISGGVAANKRIREKMTTKLAAQQTSPTFYFPPLSLCTDNAAMIGAYAAFHLDKQTSWEDVKLSLKRLD